MSTIHASPAPLGDASSAGIGAPPSSANRKESPYLTWVKQLPQQKSIWPAAPCRRALPRCLALSRLSLR